jgi:hypothetical protein
LKPLQEQNEVLLLEHFYSHWHLRRDGAPQMLLERRQRIEPVDRALQSSSIPKQSTRRQPSLFEGVEKAPAAPWPQRLERLGVSDVRVEGVMNHQSVHGW